MNSNHVGWTRRRTLGAAVLTVGAAAGGAGLGLPIPAAVAADKTYSVTSPDDRLKVTIRVGSALSWQVQYDGKDVLLRSGLSLTLADGTVIGPGARVTDSETISKTATWTPPFGQQSKVNHDHRQLAVSLVDDTTGIHFAVVVRALNGAAAIKYQLVSAAGSTVSLAEETTEFAFPSGATAWASRAEGDYVTVAPGDIPNTSGRDSGKLADQPLTVKLANGFATCITESDLNHYPRMRLVSVRTDTVATKLAHHAAQGDSTAEPTFSVSTPSNTPWRVLLVGRTPVALAGRASLVPALSRSSVFSDTSWIKPGTAIREVTLSTKGGKACVDFAADRGMRYVLYDAGWYGHEYDAASDATEVNPDPDRIKNIPGWAGLDLQEVIDYGKEKGVGILLYVNRLALERQLDDILPLYRSWGAAGIKMGFISSGRQKDTDWLYNAIKMAGDHKLVVDTHDDVRPAGLDRTLPNWLTIEGVRGNENMPTARHNVTLPFTRNLAGPMDYTVCFHNARDQVTDAHKLASAVVYYSPLTLLYWYDQPNKYANNAYPATDFWRQLPTTWAETRVLAGDIGEYVVTARRSGSGWWVGAMTNESARSVTVDLGFLGSGQWQAELFTDGTLANPVVNTPVSRSTRTVRSGDSIRLNLVESGGAAIRLTTS